MSIRITNEGWATDPEARAIRVEVAPGRSYLFPHEHFIQSELIRGEDGDTLTIDIADHRITVQGRQLHRVELALQRRQLSLLASIVRKITEVEGTTLVMVVEVSSRIQEDQ